MYGAPWQMIAEAAPKLLRHTYWNKYNTIRIPLQTPNQAFTGAMAAARDAHDSKILEEQIAQLHAKQIREFEEVFARVHRNLPDTAS